MNDGGLYETGGAVGNNGRRVADRVKSSVSARNCCWLLRLCDNVNHSGGELIYSC